MCRPLFAAFVMIGLFLGLATLAADAPTALSPVLKTEHHANAKYDFTLITALDGHLALVAKSAAGGQLYNGPYTTPLERAEMSAPLRREFRLLQVYDELLARRALALDSPDEWTIIGARVEAVIRDQSFLEVDFNNELLVCNWPKLSALDNPLGAAAEQLALAASMQPMPDNETKAALITFRDARTKLLDVLEKHQRDLMTVSTIRQETIFVRMGILK